MRIGQKPLEARCALFLQPRRRILPHGHGSDQGSPSPEELVGKLDDYEVGGGLRSEREQLIHRSLFAPRTRPVRENGQGDGSRPAHTVVAMHQRCAAHLRAGEREGLSDLIRRRHLNAERVVVDILEREHEMCGSGLAMEAQAVCRAAFRILQRDDRVEATLVFAGL